MSNSQKRKSRNMAMKVYFHAFFSKKNVSEQIEPILAHCARAAFWAFSHSELWTLKSQLWKLFEWTFYSFCCNFYFFCLFSLHCAFVCWIRVLSVSYLKLVYKYFKKKCGKKAPRNLISCYWIWINVEQTNKQHGIIKTYSVENACPFTYAAHCVTQCRKIYEIRGKNASVWPFGTHIFWLELYFKCFQFNAFFAQAYD